MPVSLHLPVNGECLGNESRPDLVGLPNLVHQRERVAFLPALPYYTIKPEERGDPQLEINGEVDTG